MPTSRVYYDHGTGEPVVARTEVKLGDRSGACLVSTLDRKENVYVRAIVECDQLPDPNTHPVEFDLYKPAEK